MGSTRFILRQLHDIAATVGKVLQAAQRYKSQETGRKKSRFVQFASFDRALCRASALDP
jgi:hypothetical protein